MKNLALLLIILMVACKKEVQLPKASPSLNAMHGIVNIDISSNSPTCYILILKNNQINMVVNHKTLYESTGGASIQIDTKDTARYQIYALAGNRHNSDTLDKNKLWIKLKAVDQFDKVIIDSLRWDDVFLSSKWRTGIDYTFTVK